MSLSRFSPVAEETSALSQQLVIKGHRPLYAPNRRYSKFPRGTRNKEFQPTTFSITVALGANFFCHTGRFLWPLSIRLCIVNWDRLCDGRFAKVGPFES